MTNSLNLAEINTETATSLVRFFMQTGQNVLLLGQSGIGKSSIPCQIATECHYKLGYVNLSAMERPDVQGYPILDDSSDVIQYKSPYFLPALQPNQKADTIILFDEVDKCEHEITAPLLEILQQRTINGRPLNIVGCVLTGNLPDERAFSNQISSALLDRCAKYLLSFNFENWLVWARENGVHELILGFLTSHPELACGKIYTGLTMASESPRGWTLASDALIRARKQRLVDHETITHIVAGFVGYEAAFQFSVWYKHFRHFEPAVLSLVENGNCTMKYEELTPTEQLVFCISAAHFAKTRFLQESKSKPRYKYVDNLCKFLVQKEVAAEIQAVSLSNAFPFSLVADPKYKLYQSKLFFELVSKLSIKQS